MRTVAAIDCGTNSLRLLVAGVLDADGEDIQLLDVDRRMEVVRLGQGVDRTGMFAPEALQRTFDVLRDYVDVMRGYGVQLSPDSVRMVATSATRDAANRDEFVSGVRKILGVEPEVISGEEEAELSFVGATAELEAMGEGSGLHRPYLVVDVGGGSTEFVLGHTGDAGASAVRAQCSVNIGCVRMTERHFHADPPTAEQVAAATADRCRWGRPRPWCAWREQRPRWPGSRKGFPPTTRSGSTTPGCRWSGSVRSPLSCWRCRTSSGPRSG